MADLAKFPSPATGDYGLFYEGYAFKSPEPGRKIISRSLDIKFIVLFDILADHKTRCFLHGYGF